MGRYCFFNTGMEYKFAFASQESTDILLFGGRPIVENGEFAHVWTAEDRPEIEKTLRNLEGIFCLEPLCLDAFAEEVSGTSALLSSLDTCIPTYRLGAIILHQLRYQPNLVARYEI